MSFFDKQQDVIDIKLTQFGKNLLARGAFKPVYYRFFDDGILYNSECAGYVESQKRSEERIREAQYLRTQHLATPVYVRYDQNENLINDGALKTFMEINRRQDPLVADKILKYPLQNSRVNSPNAPSITVRASDTQISSSADVLLIDSVPFPVPQLHFSSSYELVEDRSKQENIPSESELLDLEIYMDLMSNKLEFLDKSSLEMREENVVIEMEELHVDPIDENFEIEIYEIDDLGNLIKLETEERVKNYFNIEVDEQFTENGDNTRRHERFYRKGRDEP